jgi:hypothetical protein
MELLCKLCDSKLNKYGGYYSCNCEQYARGLYTQASYCWEAIDIGMIRLTFQDAEKIIKIQDYSRYLTGASSEDCLIAHFNYEELTKENVQYYLNKLKKYITFL